MEHYFTQKPKSRSKEKKIEYHFFEKTFIFLTSSSVFSKDKIDLGTNLLIKESKITDAKILDIGCGYGVVGIVLKTLYPKADITMSDVNERALLLAQHNCTLNSVEIKTIKSHLFDNIKEKFDIILSNPPQSAGKKLCFDLIQQSYGHLSKKGVLQLVARPSRGGRSLAGKMKEVFGNVTIIGRKSGYSLYYSEKN